MCKNNTHQTQLVHSLDFDTKISKKRLTWRLKFGSKDRKKSDSVLSLDALTFGLDKQNLKLTTRDKWQHLMYGDTLPLGSCVGYNGIWWWEGVKAHQRLAGHLLQVETKQSYRNIGISGERSPLWGEFIAILREVYKFVKLFLENEKLCTHAMVGKYSSKQHNKSSLNPKKSQLTLLQESQVWVFLTNLEIGSETQSN